MKYVCPLPSLILQKPDNKANGSEHSITSSCISPHAVHVYACSVCMTVGGPEVE